MVEGESLRVFGADNMDPVETVVDVLPHLPSRPHLVAKRNGVGRRYHVLRRRVRVSSTRGRNDDIYLGQLTPLQQLAVRQAISDAGERNDWISATQQLRRLAAQKKDYREGRAILSVLAQRAGFTLHGYALRKKTMTTQTTRTNHAVPTPTPPPQRGSATPMADEDPIVTLRRGLTVMHDFGSRIFHEAGFALKTRLLQNGCRQTGNDQRVLDALLDLGRHQRVIAESIANLGGRIEG
jgi:hypothetical protein